MGQLAKPSISCALIIMLVVVVVNVTGQSLAGEK